MHYVYKNNLFLARLHRISANLNENYRPYNFQALANISGNFQKNFYSPSTDTMGTGPSAVWNQQRIGPHLLKQTDRRNFK